MRRWVMGEFSEPRQLIGAIKHLRKRGHSKIDAYSPYPLHETSDALGLRRSKVPLFALVGGLSGVALGYGMQWYCNAYDWPINVGNRAPHAPPSFIPITFELGILFSAIAIIASLFALFRFPQPYHPLFELAAFRSASVDRFWVSIEPTGQAEVQNVREELEQLGAQKVSVVEGSP